MMFTLLFFFFFFQAEDGIRDIGVTGVQTCALPIWAVRRRFPASRAESPGRRTAPSPGPETGADRWKRRRSAPRCSRRSPRRAGSERSEERRVGKECRSRWWAEHEEKKRKNRQEAEQ